MNTPDLSPAMGLATKLCNTLERVIQGRSDTLRLVITGLLADGHVLIEDYPGSGKTLLTKTLGRLIAKDGQERDAEHILPFRRVQFTPDMLPGDVLGVNVFDPNTGTFRFVHGPVFAHIVLADELNRTGPKVQAAFLECMAEKQVTIDNVTHKLDDLFFVIGTQNPLDLAGTYPLPLVQLDRFLLRIPMSYVNAETEMEILRTHGNIMEAADSLEPICTRGDILRARSLAEHVQVTDGIRRAIVEIVQSTRNNPQLQFGVSTRAALMAQKALRAWALIRGRDYATEDDLKTILPHVFLHRLRFHGGIANAQEAFARLVEPILERLVRAG